MRIAVFCLMFLILTVSVISPFREANAEDATEASLRPPAPVSHFSYQTRNVEIIIYHPPYYRSFPH